MMNKNLPQYIISYLKKFSIQKWNIELTERKKFNNVIVIPAIQEYENIIGLLNSFSQNIPEYFNETLLLFVINNPKNCNDEIKIDNAKSLELLRNNQKFSENISQLNIGVIGASSDGLELPDKDAGVGLARKTGMDLALTVFDYQNPRKKILICLDADCIVEKNYLSEIVSTFNQKNINAATVYYEHILPEDYDEKIAIINYELFLRYYLLGLKYANSPYAYQTIGSTIVCDDFSYCKVGGMNKRKAGEDFYFLEKLSKITKIHYIKNTTVYPSPRVSMRVPFGTGKSVNKFLNKTDLLVYNPESFEILKQWLKVFNEEKEDYLLEAEKIDYLLKEFLIISGFQKAWKNILKNSKSKEQLQKQKSIWFDAFRTMKLIHYLRDKKYYPINLIDAINDLLKRNSININILSNTELEIKLEYLKLLREYI